MSCHTDEAKMDAKIAKVVSQGSLDSHTKESMIKIIRSNSIIQQTKSNSFQTVMSISNTMVGTSTLVFPILYRDSGILTSLIVSIIIAMISTKTAQINVQHNKSDELDLPDTIIRILGLRWQQFSNINNILLLYLTGMIYMILICNQIYPLLGLILQHFDLDYALQNHKSFTQVSYQWTGIAYFFIIFPLMCLKDLRILLKLVPLGLTSVISFFLFIIYSGINNIITQGFGVFSELNLISADFATIAGVFTLAFLVQPFVVPIAKNNKYQKNNERDIKIAFGWTWLVYQIVGIFGAVAITGVTRREGTQGSTVLDYFENNWMVIIIQILLLMQLTFVFPVIQFITRAQFFTLLYGVEKPPNWQFYGFTLFYALSCLVAQMLEADLSLIISLTGALVGLFVIYIIPIVLHLTCLYGNLIRVSSDDTSNRSHQFIQTTQTDLLSSTLEGQNYSDNNKLNSNDNQTCNDHMDKLKTFSKQQRVGFFLVLVIFGTFIAVTKVINVLFQ